jgi:hypothetical protein
MDMKIFKEIREIKEKTGHAYICPRCCNAFVDQARFLNNGFTCQVCNGPINNTLIVPVLDCDCIAEEEKFTVLENGTDIKGAQEAWPTRKEIGWVIRQQAMIAEAMRKCQDSYEERILRPFKDPM